MKLHIQERLQKLGSDMLITDYAGDIANLCANKPKEYRILYDAQADLYMICGAWDHIHIDMIKEAFRSGWYEDQKQFIQTNIGFYNRGMGVDYFSFGTESIGLDEYDEDDFDLSLFSDKVNRDDNYIYPWIYCFGFLPPDSKSANDLTKDGYNHKYKFSFGTLFTRDFELSETPELKQAFDRLN